VSEVMSQVFADILHPGSNVGYNTCDPNGSENRLTKRTPR
jgi:hypothetical protein